MPGNDPLGQNLTVSTTFWQGVVPVNALIGCAAHLSYLALPRPSETRLRGHGLTAVCSSVCAGSPCLLAGSQLPQVPAQMASRTPSPLARRVLKRMNQSRCHPTGSPPSCRGDTHQVPQEPHKTQPQLPHENNTANKVSRGGDGDRDGAGLDCGVQLSSPTGKFAA